MGVWSLRASAVAVASFFIAAPAYANGQVENAMQLWMGDLRSNYNYTIQNYESGATDSAAGYAKTLAQQAEQLNQMVSAIQSAGANLSPELGAAWSESQSAASELSDAAETVAGQIGNTKPDIDDLKSAFEEVDDSINESWEFTKTFGASYGKVVSTYVEPIKASFQGEITNLYKTMTQYISNENISAAKSDSEKLKELTAKLAADSVNLGTAAGAFSRSLADIWKPADVEISKFDQLIGVTKASLGSQSVQVSMIDSFYGNANAGIVRAYADVMAFGEKLGAITDDWR